MLLFTKVSQATRLSLSCARQASKIASEIVSQTLSGWPSPTDSEEKIYRRGIYLLKYCHTLIRPMAFIVNSLRAISDPTRLRLLLVLLEEELTVAELQEIL